MGIAITGQAGQVVNSLVAGGVVAEHEVIALGRTQLNLADLASVSHALDVYD